MGLETSVKNCTGEALTEWGEKKALKGVFQFNCVP